MSHCSQCGRYVGPYEACPYCGARMTGRISIRAVKSVAVVLATVGLFFLWRAATHAAIPRVQIGQVGATMNMAYARVEGWVVRGPEFYSETGYLSFTVADDTGEVRVSAYRNETDGLRAAGRVPALGDRVSAAGTLRVREEGVALTVNVPEHVEVLRPEPVEREIGAIAAGDRLQRVRLRGQVWSVRRPYPGLVILTVRDHTGEIDVAVAQALEQLSGVMPLLEPGQSVEIVGTVDLYRDSPQIVPLTTEDVVLLAEPLVIAPHVSAGAMTGRHAGRLVTVEGQVVEASTFSAGSKVILEDSTGRVTLLLWQDLLDTLGDVPLKVGARVRVTGEVSIYQGEVEVIPERTIDVRLLARGEGDEAPPTVLIAELDVGSRATVEGVVVDIAPFASGFTFTLDDGTGQINLVVWLSIYDALIDPGGMDDGARVWASGLVQVYEGALQIVPAEASDVVTIGPAAAKPVPCEIGSLSGSEIGALVTVEGAIVGVEYFTEGYRIRLGDGTGEVLIIVWRSLYERVPGREQLVLGTWVRASGIVEAYRGTLELVPRLPHDVSVLEP